MIHRRLNLLAATLLALLCATSATPNDANQAPAANDDDASTGCARRPMSTVELLNVTVRTDGSLRVNCRRVQAHEKLLNDLFARSRRRRSLANFLDLQSALSRYTSTAADAQTPSAAIARDWEALKDSVSTELEQRVPSLSMLTGALRLSASEPLRAGGSTGPLLSRRRASATSA